jgi:hypothetical protein
MGVITMSTRTIATRSPLQQAMSSRAGMSVFQLLAEVRLSPCRYTNDNRSNALLDGIGSASCVPSMLILARRVCAGE